MLAASCLSSSYSHGLPMQRLFFRSPRPRSAWRLARSTWHRWLGAPG